MEVEVEENGASAGRGEVFQGGEGGAEMEVEDGEDGASAGRVGGGTDAAPARPASAGAIQQMMVAFERGHQARGGVPGGGSTDDAAGSGSEGQQGSGTHLAGQVAVAGDGGGFLKTVFRQTLVVKIKKTQESTPIILVMPKKNNRG